MQSQGATLTCRLLVWSICHAAVAHGCGWSAGFCRHLQNLQSLEMELIGARRPDLTAAASVKHGGWSMWMLQVPAEHGAKETQLVQDCAEVLCRLELV